MGRGGPRGDRAQRPSHRPDRRTERGVGGGEGRRLRPRRARGRERCRCAPARPGCASRSSRRASRCVERGIEVPILVLSEQPPEELDAVVEHRLTCTVYSRAQVVALAAAAQRRDRIRQPVHLKVDTGMRRVGVAPARVREVVESVGAASPWLELDGVFTHLARGGRADHPFTAEQLDLFDAVARRARSRAGSCCRGGIHAANSAGALAHPRARYDAGARRDRDLRHVSGRAAGAPHDGAAPGDVAARTRLAREAGARGRADLVRAPAHVRRRHDGGDAADRVRGRRTATARSSRAAACCSRAVGARSSVSSPWTS